MPSKEQTFYQKPIKLTGASKQKSGKQRLGFKISRELLSPDEADSLLVESQIILTLKAKGKDDAPLFGNKDEIKIAATVEVKGIGINAEWITGGFTFQIDEAEEAETWADLMHLGHRDALVWLKRTGHAGEITEQDDPDQSTIEDVAE